MSSVRDAAARESKRVVQWSTPAAALSALLVVTACGTTQPEFNQDIAKGLIERSLAVTSRFRRARGRVETGTEQPAQMLGHAVTQEERL